MAYVTILNDSNGEIDFLFFSRYNTSVGRNMFSFRLWGDNLGIDLGTTNTLVYAKSKGIVLNIPSVMAIGRKDGRVMAIGKEAKEMVGKTPENILAVRPMQDGVIADFDIAQKMMRYFIDQVQPRRLLMGPKLIIGVPFQATKVEKRAVVEIAMQIGARRVHLVAEPVAAAIGANLPVSEPLGNLIVDIGGGTSEAAITSLNGVVICRTIRIAGDEMDQAAIQHLRDHHSLVIGEQMAERVKIEVGCVCVPAHNEKMKVRGRDLNTGFPNEIEIDSEEVSSIFSPVVDTICEMIEATLEESPPEISGDIMERGLYLTGGVACLRGLDKYISQRTGLTVYLAEEPLLSVVMGIGKLLKDRHFLSLVEMTP